MIEKARVRKSKMEEHFKDFSFLPFLLPHDRIIEEMITMMWDGWMPVFGMWGGIMMLVFWVAVVVGIVFLVKWIVDPSRTNQRSDESPLEILKRGYAAGEITKEEFEEKKRDLGLG
jgi:putative membrane protein